MEPFRYQLALALAVLVAAIAVLPVAAPASPGSWAVFSTAVWLLYVTSGGWSSMDKHQLLWALGSIVAFLHFLQYDPEFRGWGDVYFFCGARMEYCSCDFRWNVLGWTKATVLWNFVLTTAVGAQRLALQVGLDGLLPGEEVVTKESFVSICWRLIPYWLNNWEQQWGAECSSMMFELPHFAVELLVILPCVQILCSRMKILAMPLVALPAGAEDQQGFVREEFAPNILKGFWEHHPERRRMMPRLRANARLMTFTVAITALAAFNAMCVPLYLEHQITMHPSTAAVQLAVKHLNWDEIRNSSVAPSLDVLLAAGITEPSHYEALLARFARYSPRMDQPWGMNATYSSLNALLPNSSVADHFGSIEGAPAGGPALSAHLPASLSEEVPGVAAAGHAVQDRRACSNVDRLAHNMKKHADEIKKMQDMRHMELIPLVESALAIMRLSCEKYFVLVSVFVSYLLFQEPPRMARLVIRLNSRLSTIFQKVILYSFPAVCWIYGAGYIFSTFVSVVFWGGPALIMYQSLRSNSSSIRIKSLKAAVAADIERMGGNCAICWGEMVVPGAAAAASPAMPGPEHPAAAPPPHPQPGLGTAAGASDTLPAASAASGSSNAGTSGAGPQQQPSAAADPAGAGTPGRVPALRAADPNVDERPVLTAENRQALEGTAPDVAPATADPPAAAEGAAGDGAEPAADGFSLPCSHAYHHSCLHQWLHQCHAQGTTARCPLCQAVIQLEVTWRFPYPWARQGAADLRGEGWAAPEQLVMNPNNAINPDELQMLGLLDHQREVQEMLRDMPQILPPEGALALPEEPPEQPQQLHQIRQLQQERRQLLEERMQLVERRQLLQEQVEAQRLQVEAQRLHVEAQRLQLQRLRDVQAVARQQEQGLLQRQGDLIRRLLEVDGARPQAEEVLEEASGAPPRIAFSSHKDGADRAAPGAGSSSVLASLASAQAARRVAAPSGVGFGESSTSGTIRERPEHCPADGRQPEGACVQQPDASGEALTRGPPCAAPVGQDAGAEGAGMSLADSTATTMREIEPWAAGSMGQRESCGTAVANAFPVPDEAPVADVAAAVPGGRRLRTAGASLRRVGAASAAASSGQPLAGPGGPPEAGLEGAAVERRRRFFFFRRKNQ